MLASLTVLAALSTADAQTLGPCSNPAYSGTLACDCVTKGSTDPVWWTGVGHSGCASSPATPADIGGTCFSLPAVLSSLVAAGAPTGGSAYTTVRGFLVGKAWNMAATATPQHKFDAGVPDLIISNQAEGTLPEPWHYTSISFLEPFWTIENDGFEVDVNVRARPLYEAYLTDSDGDGIVDTLQAVVGFPLQTWVWTGVVHRGTYMIP